MAAARGPKAPGPLSPCTGGTGTASFERASDPWVTFAPDGTAYQVSLSFNNIANGDNAILVSRSADGGRTWSVATTLRRDAGAPALLRVMRSADKGATWSAPVTISDLQTVGTSDPDTGTGIRDASAIAAIAVGANAVLATTWQDSRFAQGAYDGIAFSKSIDGGSTWSAPIRINGNPAVFALVPSVAIASDGTIGVAYYDFRCNTPDPATLLTDYWLATSSDGITWSERRIAGPFDYAKAPLVGDRYFLGDYTGMTSAGTSFVTVFGRANDDASNRSDILTSLARPSAETQAAVQAVMTAVDPGTAPAAHTSARIRAAIRNALRARERGPGPTTE